MTIRIVLPVLGVLLLAGPLTAQTTEERNEATFRAMVEAMEARDLDRLDDLIAPDVVRRSQATPGVVVEGLEDFKAFLRSDWAVVPDSRQTCPLTVAEGDRMVVWCNYEGTQQGPMGPFPATGKSVALDFGGVLRFEDGKVAEIRAVWDRVAALTQLGHLPPTSGEPAGLSPVEPWTPAAAGPEAETRNRAAFAAFVEAQNDRDWARLDDMVRADMIRHSQATPGREEIRGVEPFKAFLVRSTEEMPDWRIECPTVVAEDDRIGVWCTYTGTQTGPMGPFPASGKRMELDFTGILRFEEGKIAEWWVVWDNLAALTQLGHFPPAGGTGEDAGS